MVGGVVVEVTITKNKRPYKGGCRGRGECGGRGISDKRVQLNYNGKPPHGIDWVEDKFYEPWFYAKFLVEQNIRLHEL